MRVVVALTVNSGDKVLQGTAVQRESSRPLPLLVLLNGLQDELFLEEKIGAGISECKRLRLSDAYACMQGHTWRHVGQAWRQTFNQMCTCAQSIMHSLFTVIYSTHAHASTYFTLVFLPLSLGSLRLACAPNPQRDGWRTLQRWSGHLDFSLAAATEGPCSFWTPWPRVGAHAQNTTLLCCTQSTGQAKGKGQQIVAKDLLVSHHYLLSKDDLKPLHVNPWVMDHMLMQSKVRVWCLAQEFKFCKAFIIKRTVILCITEQRHKHNLLISSY